MTKQKYYKAAFVNDIIWAAMIIAVAWITAGAISDEKSFLLLILQIAGWMAINGAIRGSTSVKEEWTCIKRKLGSKG